MNLLAEDSAGVDTASPRTPTKADIGLVKLAPGPERLLGEMVKRGLGVEHLHTAASLVLELDRPRGGPTA